MKLGLSEGDMTKLFRSVHMTTFHPESSLHLGQRDPTLRRFLTPAMVHIVFGTRTLLRTLSHLYQTPTPQRRLATRVCTPQHLCPTLPFHTSLPCGHFLLPREFDRDANGYVSFDELLLGLRGQLNERRLDMVKRCFKVLDKTGDGAVTLADLERRYDATRHPDVVAGTKTQRMVGGPGCGDTTCNGCRRGHGGAQGTGTERIVSACSTAGQHLGGGPDRAGWQRAMVLRSGRQSMQVASGYLPTRQGTALRAATMSGDLSSFRAAGAAGVPGHLRVGGRRHHGRRPGDDGGVRQLLRVSDLPYIGRWPRVRVCPVTVCVGRDSDR